MPDIIRLAIDGSGAGLIRLEPVLTQDPDGTMRNGVIVRLLTVTPSSPPPPPPPPPPSTADTTATRADTTIITADKG